MINVTKTFLPSRKKFSNYIDQIYETSWLTNNGPLCQQLEAELKKFLGVENLILVSNGTLALQVAYRALAIEGTAITTPFSFVATASSLIWENIKPVFADIDINSWNISTEQVEAVIQSDTSAIVPVHVFGNPCDVEKIDEIAKKHKLKVIYDAAHAFGVNYKNESILNWGDISVLSFHATKLFHTIEGGAIITSDADLAKKIRLMTNFGITGPETIECLGINCKMNEFQAAMGLCILEEIEIISSARKVIWEFYRANLPSELGFQKWNPYSNQNYHYFPVLFENEIGLKKVQFALNEKQIFPRRYFYPSLDSLAFIDGSKVMKSSRDISGRILCLPISTDINKEELVRIVDIIKKAV